MASGNPEVVRSPSSALLPWILLVLVAAGFGVYLFRDQVANFLSSDRPVEQPEVTVLAGEGVLQRIQELNNLETVAFRMETVVTATNELEGLKKWLWEKKALFIASGEVTAGVSLNRLTAADVRVSGDGKIVRITLPPATILDTNLEPLELYDFENGVLPFNDLDETMRQQAHNKAREKLQETACASDILEMATANAKRSVENLFALMDVEVLVETTPATTCGLAGSQ